MVVDLEKIEHSLRSDLAAIHQRQDVLKGLLFFVDKVEKLARQFNLSCDQEIKPLAIVKRLPEKSERKEPEGYLLIQIAWD